MKFKLKDNLLYFFFVTISIICLAFTLIFPISPDLTIFMLAGRSIAEGGKIYVDYLDLKAPFVYYFFSLVYRLFGIDEFRIRIFDFIYQALTVFSIIFILKKVFTEKYLPAIGGFIYALIYSNLQFAATFQVESLIGLPLIWIIYLNSKNENTAKTNIIISGLLLGLIIGLKYTFGIILLPIVLFNLYDYKKSKDSLICVAILLISSGLGFLLSSISLIDSQIRNGYIDILKLLSTYSNIPPFSIDLLQTALKNTGNFFGDYFSITLTFLVILSVSVLFKSPKNDREKFSFRVLSLSILLAIVLLLSILIEKKFFIYHYSRLYLPLTILSVFAIKLLIDYYHEYKSNLSKLSKLILITLVPIAILFSPLPRIIKSSKLTYLYLKDKNKWRESYEIAGDVGTRKQTFYKIANFIKSDMQTNDKIIVMTHGAQEINLLFNAKNISKFAHSNFYFGLSTSNKWKKDIVEETRRTNYIVLSNSNNTYLQTGTNLSTFESLKTIPELDSIITNNFKLVYKLDEFMVLKRN